MNYTEILNKSINSGVSGGSAMIFQVSSLMWLRTTMNYQYKNGGKTIPTITKLYKEGGVPRLYRGYIFAIAQGPISRFGDAAFNEASNLYLKDQPMAIKTGVGSLGAAFWRITIMPIDAFKSNLQVHDKNGIQIINNRIKTGGFRSLYHGGGATIGATMIGHYPWFLTYNYLSDNVPKFNNNIDIVRSMGIGFTSSTVSDIISNSLRVLKINKQTDTKITSYTQSFKNIIEKEGFIGLFTRGLKTKLLINGFQSSIFVVVFDYLKKL